MEQIQKVVDQIADDLKSFRQGYDTRIEKLEKMDILSRRPQFESKAFLASEEGQIHKTAFSAYMRKGEEQDLQNVVTKSLSTAVDTEGGYLIPQMIEERITHKIEEVSPLRRLANIMTISSSAVEMLVNGKSIAEAGWAAETAARAETAAPVLNKIRIPVHELYARPRATQKLLDDSVVDVENWLSAKIANRMTQLENIAFITGDGKNKPRGILTYPTASKNDWEWGKFEHVMTNVAGGFPENSEADVLINTVGALKAEYLKGSVWLMSRTAHTAVQRLKDQVGHYLWQPGIGQNAVPTLLGYPVEIAEEMPELIAGEASKSIIFGNFKEAYQIVDRAGTTVLRDPYSAKPYVEFYTVKRVGGDVINFEALKIVNFDKLG